MKFVTFSKIHKLDFLGNSGKSHPINWLTLTMAEIQRVTLTGFARAAVPSCPRSRSHKHVFNDTSSNWKTKEIKTSRYWSHHEKDGENTSERCWKIIFFCGSRWAKWFQAAKCSRPEFHVERFVHFWQFIKHLVRNQFNPKALWYSGIFSWIQVNCQPWGNARNLTWQRLISHPEK